MPACGLRRLSGFDIRSSLEKEIEYLCIIIIINPESLGFVSIACSSCIAYASVMSELLSYVCNCNMSRGDRGLNGVVLAGALAGRPLFINENIFNFGEGLLPLPSRPFFGRWSVLLRRYCVLLLSFWLFGMVFTYLFCVYVLKVDYKARGFYGDYDSNQICGNWFGNQDKLETIVTLSAFKSPGSCEKQKSLLYFLYPQQNAPCFTSYKSKCPF